jgi:RimJ/RimL family protein N-acetyltransferase
MNALAFPASRPEYYSPPVEKADETLELERLVLCRPAEEHIVAMTALASNLRIASRLYDMPYPYTIADAGRFLRRLRDRRGNLTAFAITQRESGTLIGCCKIETEETDGESRIGFWIGEVYWNRGYMTEAMQALVDYAFGRSPGLTTIRTSVQATNPAARRVLEKCGFQYAGPGTQRDIRQGCLVPVDHYRMDRGIWLAIKGWSRVDAGQSPGFRHWIG